MGDAVATPHRIVLQAHSTFLDHSLYTAAAAALCTCLVPGAVTCCPPSQLFPQSPLSIITNLEAVIRDPPTCWAEQQPDPDASTLQLPGLALSAALYGACHSQHLHGIIQDSSQSPALLSLLLSCVKRLQEHCRKATSQQLPLLLHAATTAAELGQQLALIGADGAPCIDCSHIAQQQQQQQQQQCSVCCSAANHVHPKDISSSHLSTLLSRLSSLQAAISSRQPSTALQDAPATADSRRSSTATDGDSSTSSTTVTAAQLHAALDHALKAPMFAGNARYVLCMQGMLLILSALVLLTFTIALTAAVQGGLQEVLVRTSAAYFQWRYYMTAAVLVSQILAACAVLDLEKSHLTKNHARPAAASTSDEPTGALSHLPSRQQTLSSCTSSGSMDQGLRDALTATNSLVAFEEHTSPKSCTTGAGAGDGQTLAQGAFSNSITQLAAGSRRLVAACMAATDAGEACTGSKRQVGGQQTMAAAMPASSAVALSGCCCQTRSSFTGNNMAVGSLPLMPASTAAGQYEAATVGIWLVLVSRALYTASTAMQLLSTAGHDKQRGSWAVGGVASALTGRRDYSPSAVLARLSALVHWMGPVLQQLQESADTTGAAAAAAGGKSSQVVLCAPMLAGVIQQHGKLQAILEATAAIDRVIPGNPAVCGCASGSGAAVTQMMCQLAWSALLSTKEGQQLPGALSSFSSMLCAALPTKHCCNEPSCCCLDKVSELQLAGGKGSKCGGCGAARYCGVKDQQLHWKMHKAVCQAMSPGGGRKKKARAVAAIAAAASNWRA